MATLATGLLTIAFALQPNIEPRVTWYFLAEGCQACMQKQAELMADYAAQWDQIVLVSSDTKPMLQPVIQILESKLPNHTIKMEDTAKVSGTGFVIEDPTSNEIVSYFSTGGSYVVFRAEQVLALFRKGS